MDKYQKTVYRFSVNGLADIMLQKILDLLYGYTGYEHSLSWFTYDRDHWGIVYIQPLQQLFHILRCDLDIAIGRF